MVSSWTTACWCTHRLACWRHTHHTHTHILILIHTFSPHSLCVAKWHGTCIMNDSRMSSSCHYGQGAAWVNILTLHGDCTFMSLIFLPSSCFFNQNEDLKQCCIYRKTVCLLQSEDIQYIWCRDSTAIIIYSSAWLPLDTNKSHLTKTILHDTFSS